MMYRGLKLRFNLLTLQLLKKTIYDKTVIGCEVRHKKSLYSVKAIAEVQIV